MLATDVMAAPVEGVPVERRQITFAVTELSPALVGELMPLVREHYAEIAHYQDIALDIDWKGYFAAQLLGKLKVFTARDGDGELVGYATFLVGQNLHYRGSLQALQDVIYVDPHARGRTGSQFIDFCDDRLREMGVQVVYHHVKVAHDFGKMLARKGYTLIDQIWGKRLDVDVAPPVLAGTANLNPRG